MLPPDGRFAPAPPATLHLGNLRTALLAWLFARSQDARFLCASRTSTPAACAPSFEARAARTTSRALGLDWDGAVVRQSERLDAATRDALARLDGARTCCTACWCTRAEIREAASAPHGDAARGRLPRHVPRARRRRAAPQRERRAAGRRRCACAPARRASRFDDRLRGEVDRRGRRLRRAPQRRRATPTTWPSSSTTPSRASARSCAARTCSTRRRASSGSASGSGCRRPRHAHVPLMLGARRRAAGQAPRRGHARRPGRAGRVARRRARDCSLRSVGLGELGERSPRRSSWRASPTRPCEAADEAASSAGSCRRSIVVGGLIAIVAAGRDDRRRGAAR